MTDFLLVLQFFLAYGLKYLWNLINLFQFLVFFLMWKISIDDFTEIVLNVIKSFALFEFVDTTDLQLRMRSFLTGDSLIYLKCVEGLIEDKLVCVEFDIGAVEDGDQRRLQDEQSSDQ
jgi:hypothetical protein